MELTIISTQTPSAGVIQVEWEVYNPPGTGKVMQEEVYLTIDGEQVHSRVVSMNEDVTYNFTTTIDGVSPGKHVVCATE